MCSSTTHIILWTNTMKARKVDTILTHATISQTKFHGYYDNPLKQLSMAFLFYDTIFPWVDGPSILNHEILPVWESKAPRSCILVSYFPKVSFRYFLKLFSKDPQRSSFCDLFRTLEGTSPSISLLKLPQNYERGFLQSFYQQSLPRIYPVILNRFP